MADATAKVADGIRALRRIPSTSRRRIRWLLNAALLIASVGAVATGFFVDRLDLHKFVLHNQFGYAMAALMAIHIGLHWRSLRWPKSLPRPRLRVSTRARPSADPDAGIGKPPGEVRPGVAPRISRRSALMSVGGIAGLATGWFGRGALEPSPYKGGDPGIFYHRESSLGLRSTLRSLLDWGPEIDRYKTIEGAQSIPLPAIDSPPVMTVADALVERRSRRDYGTRSLSPDELAWVVHATTGLTSGRRRTAPSSGALYPIETYVAVSDVEGIDAGLYHVDVRKQALERLRSGSVANDVMVAGLGQEFLGQASAVLIFTGVFQRARRKYHARHYRYACWEGGHMAQNAYLAAEAAGLGACMVGAFFDGLVNDLLGLDGRSEAALGLMALGPR